MGPNRQSVKHLLAILVLFLPVLARGQGAGSVAVVPTLADLAIRPPSQLNPVVQVQGYRTIADWGAGRPVRYNATSTNAVDNGCVFATVTGVGRWEAPDCDGSRINVRYFGAYGNGTSNDLNYLRAAVAKLVDGSTLYSPPGYTYRITDPVYVTNDRVRVEFSGSVLKLVSSGRVPALRVGPSSDVSVSGMNFALDPTTNRVSGVPISTFAAGDMLLLYNLIQSPADYYPGQMAFVTEASGTEMVLDRFPDTALQVTNATRFVAPPDGVEVRNLTVDLSEAGDGIGISAIGRGHLIENCRVTGTGTTNDPNYIGIELRGQAITSRGNYVNGILDAGNTFDRSGYGIFAAGDGIVVENNDISDCKHDISTSERRAISPILHILSNRLRQREDWAALTDSGQYLFLGVLDVHANVKTVEIRGNDIRASRLGLSLRNGDCDVVNNRVEIVQQDGLPFVQIGNGFGEAFITRALISGNTFIAPTNASQFYWDHSDYGVSGTHRHMIWQGNTFLGAGLTMNDQEGALVNPFEDITFTGNIFERTNGTPLAFVGTVSNVVISGNVFRYGGTGNGITLAIPTNPPLGREIFISGNSFVREPGGTGFDIDATVATNIVSLAANRWSPSTFTYVGPVHGISGSITVTMHDQRDTYPRVVGTYDGKLKFGTGEAQPYSSISLLYPGAIQTDGIWTVKVSDLTAPAFGTYLNAFSNYWNYVIRGDGVHAYRYSNEVAGAVLTPIVAGPRRYEDLTNGVWRISGNLGITSNAVPIVPETSTATLWLANAAANVRDLRIVWPDGVGGKADGSLWHAYNDGSGSGLDADLVDGRYDVLFDAPTNGLPQGRKDGAWVEVAGSSHAHSDYYPRAGGTNNPITGPVVVGYSTPSFVLRDTSGTNAVTFTYGGPSGELVLGRSDPASLTSIGVSYVVFSDSQATYSIDVSAPLLLGNTVTSLGNLNATGDANVTGYINAGSDIRMNSSAADSPGLVMLSTLGFLGTREWFDGSSWNLYTASTNPPYAAANKLLVVETNGIVTVQKPIRTRTGTLGYLTPVIGHAPGSGAATLSTRNSKPVVAYDPTSEEHYRWTWVIPNGFNTPAIDGADNLVFRLHWTSSATTGSVRWVVKMQRLTDVDIDSDSFASGSVVTTAVSGTAGTVVVSTTGNVGLDSAVAGDAVEIDVYRDTGNAGDTADSDDADLLAVEIRNW